MCRSETTDGILAGQDTVTGDLADEESLVDTRDMADLYQDYRRSGTTG